MTNPRTIADLDGAAAHLRDLIENLEGALESPKVDPVQRGLLAFHVDALKEGQGVLEREVAILGMQSEGESETEPRSDGLDELEGAFQHLAEQVENLEETIGSPQVEPASRGVLSFHIDAIREALGVLQKESVRVGRAQADAIIDATMLAVQLEEAQQSTERACEEAKAAHGILEEFLASMSHELRTPLHGILSFSRLGRAKLEQGGLTPQKHAEFLQRIEECGEVLLRLVDDLLDLSRLEQQRVRLDVAPASVRGLIDDVVREFESIGEQRELAIEVRDFDDLTIEVDAGRIQQVLRNLISNAVRFAPRESRITIAVEVADGFVTVRCRDRGPGVPVEDLERVFERFVTNPRGVTSEAGLSGSGTSVGTGLGLSISRELVMAHGGTIHVENHEKGGAVFSFRVPAAR